MRFFPKLLHHKPLSHDLSALVVGLKYFEQTPELFGCHISVAEETLFTLFLEELVICVSVANKAMDPASSKLVINLSCIGLIGYNAML